MPSKHLDKAQYVYSTTEQTHGNKSSLVVLLALINSEQCRAECEVCRPLEGESAQPYIALIFPVRPEVSKDRAEPVEAFCSNQSPGSLMSSGAALSPRRATHFLLLRQEKVSKEKATLVPASPSLRYGATCGAQSSRGPASTRFAQTIAGPDPSGPALLGAFTRVLKSGIQEPEAVELTAL